MNLLDTSIMEKKMSVSSANLKILIFIPAYIVEKKIYSVVSKIPSLFDVVAVEVTLLRPIILLAHILYFF